jgi:hypothetical protein
MLFPKIPSRNHAHNLNLTIQSQVTKHHLSEPQTNMAQFQGAGQAAGLELWRIEDFKPVKLPTVDGSFYKGDSYILLSTTLSKK